jgi:hypothetical protein
MMRIKYKQFLPLFIALLLFVPIFIAAQERPEKNNELQNCETGLAYQDVVINEALEKTKGSGVLIVIARLGDGENSRELIRRRMYNVRQYFKDRGSRIAPVKVIVAEGERVKGYGRLEYYLGGELYEQLLFRKNGYICHSCCGPDERYYPEKEIYERQQKQMQKRKRRG